LKRPENPILHEVPAYLFNAEKLKNRFECGPYATSCPTAKSWTNHAHSNGLLKKHGD